MHAHTKMDDKPYNDSYFTLLLKGMVLLIDVVMDLFNITLLLFQVVIFRSRNGFHSHFKERMGEEKNKKSELQESNQRPLDCCGATTV